MSSLGTAYASRMFCMLQVFYITHILGFFTLMTFAFIHYQSMWAYTLPGNMTHDD